MRDAGFKTMNRVHRLVLATTGGILGWKAMGMPVVELRTKGRKTGHERTTFLTSPLQEGDSVVLVASRGGDDRHPAWFLNLKANPEATVRIGGGKPRRMRATVADAEERARLWPLITKDHPNYAGYQKRTSREIPVVVLRPVEA
jgi:deazaflavin-dependent oxidoreductase (nitroreductase family)